jgi:hypothetical protein
MGRPGQLLSWPPGLGNDDLQHWIEFKATKFNTATEMFACALFIPPDAMTTSYKSEYESTAMGEAGLRFLQPGGTASGKEPTFWSATTDALSAAAASFTNFEKVAANLVGAASDGAQKAMLMKQGKVLNPFIISTYKGPTDMRDHTFTFKMMPKNPTDSRNITKIVNAFKNSMLPGHDDGASENAPLGMFTYPDEFVIEYYINGTKLPDDNSNPLFRIGKSVLTQCELDYTTQDTTLFFEGTQNPVTVEMKLAFTEINVLYRELAALGY